MNANGFGVVIGIIVGLIICVIIFKICNRDGRVKQQFDERQEAIRGKGYRYAFYASMIYYALLMVLEIGEVSIPVVTPVLVFGGIVAGMITLGLYTIFKNAYWANNNNQKKYLISMIIIIIINILGGIGPAFSGRLVIDGVLQINAINLICAIMLIILIAALCIKTYLVKEEE